MGILSGLFRSRDKPTDRTAGSSYSFFLGGTASGKYVTERSAMQMTAVYCCVRILSEAVASLPLQFHRYTDDGGKEKAVEHPLYFLLHDEPNPEMTSFIFRETLMTHLLLWGNAYHATLSSSELVIYNASGADSYIHPIAIFTGGSITASSASIGTGGLTVASTITATSTGPNVWAKNSTTGCGVSIHSSSAGNHGVYSSGYYNGSKYTESTKWLLYRSTSNTVCVQGELYTHNQGYTTLRPVIGTNAGTNAIGVIVSNSASVGFYGRWAGGASASMSGRTVSCPSSDIRLKKNIKDSETDALSVINAIRIRQFDWKDPSRGHWDCGMVVDEMERDIDAKFCIGGEDMGDGSVSYKSVDTFYLQGYEVKAIQELSQKIRMLEEEIKRLKAA